MWSRRISPFDWLVVSLAGLLAVATLWAGSYPVTDTGVVYLMLFSWPIAAILWSATLLSTVSDGVAQSAALLLLVGSVTVLFPGFVFMFLMLTGALGLLIGVATAAGLFGVVLVRSPKRRVGWLLAPVIVAVTLALVFTGTPRLARMALAEPALTAYAEQILRDADVYAPRHYWADDPIVVGSIPIDEVFIRNGHVHFVTAYVGILADDPAGIAYAPAGISDPLYEHLLGPWYRWYPY